MMYFFLYAKVLLDNKLVWQQLIQFFFKFKKKNAKGKINPKIVNKLSVQSLKSCGLSRQKAKGIKELAKKLISKEFKPQLIKTMSDEEAIEYLSNLRQIGKWSAEMILLFTFNRSNIWPLQDIGLLRAISNNYNKKYFPPKKFLNKLYKKNFHLTALLQHGIYGDRLTTNQYNINYLPLFEIDVLHGLLK